jgi:hypothetical protein
MSENFERLQKQKQEIESKSIILYREKVYGACVRITGDQPMSELLTEAIMQLIPQPEHTLIELRKQYYNQLKGMNPQFVKDMELKGKPDKGGTQ